MTQNDRHRDIRPERKEMADAAAAAWNNFDAGNYELAAIQFQAIAETATAFRDRAEGQAGGDVPQTIEDAAGTAYEPHMIHMKRQAAGLSQEELADALGVTQLTVSNWENGETSPRSKHIDSLSEVLDDG